MCAQQHTIPADVPEKALADYQRNYTLITKDTNNLFLFACDQKIEHLNTDFYGPEIHPDAHDPEHIFRIAQQGDIGALATHAGLIARYGKAYSAIPYIVKLNGKTNLVPTRLHDPFSSQLWSVQEALQLKEYYNLPICGVGYTVYIGSAYESAMLAQAAHAIWSAHQHGLVTILWMYPRGQALENEHNPDLAAGATGVGLSLGADFVKIKPPQATAEKSAAQWLEHATTAAGNTHVICSGGPQKDPHLFLDTLYNQLHTGKTSGCAIGRNIFQRSHKEATAFTKAVAALVYNNASLDTAQKILS